MESRREVRGPQAIRKETLGLEGQVELSVKWGQAGVRWKTDGSFLAQGACAKALGQGSGQQKLG